MQEADIIRAGYDSVARAYAQLLPPAGTEGAPEAALEMAMLQEFIDSVPAEAEVLDAGCGTGRMITALQAMTRDTGQRFQLQGCDVSETMVGIAQEAHPHLRFMEAGLAELPYPDGQFHGVLAWYSIIHLEPLALEEVFAKISRVLRPGGFLLLGFQTGSGSRLIQRAYGKDINLTAYLHDVEDVLTRLQRCAFTERATLRRAAGAAENYGQGFLLVQSQSQKT